MKNQKILITGVAGFIGSFLAGKLLNLGSEIVGIDNLNDYYDVNLKKDRLSKLEEHQNFIFKKINLEDKNSILKIFEDYNPKVVINLAAQAGVRYSIQNPDVYIHSNMMGFYNILEASKKYPVEHLIFASSSSVYGSNKKVPFEEKDPVDNPVSLYAATKKSNELMAYTYSHLYKIPVSGLRFFTVYGPMGRPDMAYFKFLDMYFNDEPIHIYNNGDFENDLYRDFTYIEDIITGIVSLIDVIPTPEKDKPAYEIYNIGNNKPEKLMTFINGLEIALGNSLNRDISFKKIYEPIKAGDVPTTYASVEKLKEATGFKPETQIQVGLQYFTDWYVKYYDKK